MEDAMALADAGVFGMVLGLVSPPVAEAISQRIRVPTIGIGSGRGCDGQILVTYDLLGMFPWFKPRFVQAKVDLRFTNPIGGYRIHSGIPGWSWEAEAVTLRIGLRRMTSVAPAQVAIRSFTRFHKAARPSNAYGHELSA